MTRFLALAAMLGLLTCNAIAAPRVPTRGAMKGDIIKMNDQFHLIGFNYRIVKIHWIPADSTFAQAVSTYAGSATAPMGDLVFQVPVKNTQTDQDYVPLLTITVQYKDATQANGDGRPYSPAGAIANGEQLYPGQGGTFDYVVANVPQPTKENPLVKLILRNTENNDPGYPPVYRLLHPVVSP